MLQIRHGRSLRGQAPRPVRKVYEGPERTPPAGRGRDASFWLLALIPLTAFRAVTLAMRLGLLLDAFLVRQLLVPALVVLLGRGSGWPGRRLGQQPGESNEPRRADESHG